MPLMAALAGVSIGLALALQDRALGRDLEAAAAARLEEAASGSQRLLADHLRAHAVHYAAVARTPEFRANLETGHGATLHYHASALLEREAPQRSCSCAATARAGLQPASRDVVEAAAEGFPSGPEDDDRPCVIRARSRARRRTRGSSPACRTRRDRERPSSTRTARSSPRPGPAGDARARRRLPARGDAVLRGDPRHLVRADRRRARIRHAGRRRIPPLERAVTRFGGLELRAAPRWGASARCWSARGAISWAWAWRHWCSPWRPAQSSHRASSARSARSNVRRSARVRAS